LDLERVVQAERFEMVIVDEFHHAAESTQTYARLLRHLRPKVLLGLTATPERADGQSVLTWFDGRMAIELRLWEALERGLLAPFQYFGVSDKTDLRRITWKRGTGYDRAELTKLYTGHDARTSIVLQAVRAKLTDVRRMRALGFCVSIDHAEYMAARLGPMLLLSLADGCAGCTRVSGGARVPILTCAHQVDSSMFVRVATLVATPQQNVRS
jgi:superfamily II DNA or RNA helicase